MNATNKVVTPNTNSAITPALEAHIERILDAMDDKALSLMPVYMLALNISGVTGKWAELTKKQRAELTKAKEEAVKTIRPAVRAMMVDKIESLAAMGLTDRFNAITKMIGNAAQDTLSNINLKALGKKPKVEAIIKAVYYTMRRYLAGAAAKELFNNINVVWSEVNKKIDEWVKSERLGLTVLTYMSKTKEPNVVALSRSVAFAMGNSKALDALAVAFDNMDLAPEPLDIEIDSGAIDTREIYEENEDGDVLCEECNKREI